jgi:hypothetical protein
MIFPYAVSKDEPDKRLDQATNNLERLFATNSSLRGNAPDFFAIAQTGRLLSEAI